MLSHQMKSGTDIPAPPGATRPIPEWTDLKFNPLGLFNLRHRLGMLTDQPGIFTQFSVAMVVTDIFQIN
jgi:hypothetical protein